MTTPHRASAAAVLLLAALGAGCGEGDPTAVGPTATTTATPVVDPGDGGDYRPTIGPDDLVAEIDNPFLPLRPGARWVYEGETPDGLERIVVEVLDERHEVYGVSAVVVRDRAFVDGELLEDTLDWYAQDRDGNVWYLGEDTAEYEGGEVVSREGSWRAGVDGALPGIVMPADPTVGDAYRQEFLDGEAEDMGEVLALDGVVTVPLGTFDGVLTTEDWTPLEPDVVEHKSYAPGIGLILEVEVTSPDARVELVEHVAGG